MGRSGVVGGHAWRALLVAMACACAPEDLGPLPIDVCGQDEPKQILALGDDEFVDPNEGVARFGERWLFGVRRFEIPLTSIYSTMLVAEARPFAQLDARVESVGSCGEDRHVVAEDVDYLIPPLSDDEPWLGCRRDTGDLYWIDPEGAWAARPIARAIDCDSHVVRGHDVFFLLADTGDFVRARLGDAGVVVDVLVTDVVQARGYNELVDGEYVPADEVFLLRAEDRVLVRLDLATSAVDVILDRIDEFSISPDRRWVMRIRRVPSDPNDLTAPSVALVDLVEGSELGIVWHPDWLDVRGFIGDRYASIQGLNASGVAVGEVAVTIPSLRAQYLEGSGPVRGSDGDDLLVFGTLGNGAEILEISTGDRRIVVEQAESLGVLDGAIIYEDGAPYADLDMPAEYRPTNAMRMPLATLEPEVEHERSFSSVALSNDRWLATSPVDEDFLADLVLIDGKSLEVRRVDHDVVAQLRSYYRGLDLEFFEPWQTDDVVYQVHERASDRGGMWRVRFTD